MREPVWRIRSGCGALIDSVYRVRQRAGWRGADLLHFRGFPILQDVGREGFHRGFDLRHDLRDDLRMEVGYVIAFIGIGSEIIELWLREQQVFQAVGRRWAVASAVVARDVQLPLVPAGALEMHIIEVEQRIAIDMIDRTGEELPDIVSIGCLR